MARSPVVVVTGCSVGGIGAELCRAFSAKNCRVFATARRIEAMQELQDDKNIELVKLDVTSDHSITEAIGTIIHLAGRIDILVNNAGAGCVGPLAELPIENIRANFDTNVFSILSMVQAVAPIMAKQGAGKIINVGSVVGWIATPWGGSYCATKAAVHSLTHTLRMELKPLGIDVMLLIPGAIRSNIAANNMTALSLGYLSLYSKYEDDIKARASVSQSGVSTPTDVFSKAVVQKILQPKMPLQFCMGGMSTIFYILTWLPVWVVDFFIARKFGLLGPKKEAPRSEKVD